MPPILQGERWTPHAGGTCRVEPCAARRPSVEPPDPAGSLPARATFSQAAHRSGLRELEMAERNWSKHAKATVRRWLKQACDKKRQ